MDISLKNKIEGCVLGGAVGDALGYKVEFISLQQIRSRYGSAGITRYDGDALISDDTQMLLFTAAGLQYAVEDGALESNKKPIEAYVWDLYKNWYATQNYRDPASFIASGRKKYSWLSNVKELYNLRAPGITCLNALRGGVMGTIGNPINDSKGCGGVMRVAPVALYGLKYPEIGANVAMIWAKVAALTHTHPLVYSPSPLLSELIYNIILQDKRQSL